MHSLRVSVKTVLNICAFQMQCWFFVSYLNYVLSNVAVQQHIHTHPCGCIHALLHYTKWKCLCVHVVVKLPLAHCLYSDQLQSIFLVIHFTSPENAIYLELNEALFKMFFRVASNSTKKTFNYVADGKLQKATLWHSACDLTWKELKNILQRNLEITWRTLHTPHSNEPYWKRSVRVEITLKLWKLLAIMKLLTGKLLPKWRKLNG